RRHTRSKRDWSSDVCSSDLGGIAADPPQFLIPNSKGSRLLRQIFLRKMDRDGAVGGGGDDLAQRFGTAIAGRKDAGEVGAGRLRSEERRVGKECRGGRVGSA